MRKDAALAFWQLFGEIIETEAGRDIYDRGKSTVFPLVRSITSTNDVKNKLDNFIY